MNMQPDIYTIGDIFGISLSEDFEISTTIIDILEDGILISLDSPSMTYLMNEGWTFDNCTYVTESTQTTTNRSAWKGYNTVSSERNLTENKIAEAMYKGRKVQLGKPMAGDVKKSKVYVKNDKGNVVKVNFGDKKMRIKKSIPARRKSFRARHNCANPGPRWKARYWSCRAW